MTKSTFTIKFFDAPSISTGRAGADSQRARKRQLDDFCKSLIAEGLATVAKAHPVFPHDADPEMAAIFTIQVASPVSGARIPLERLRELPGVQFAQAAAERRALSAA